MGYNKNKPIVTTVKEETLSEKASEAKEKVKGEKPESKKSKGDGKKSKPKSSKTATRKKTRDPRIRISFGVFFMLLSIFVLLSFISHIINYSLLGDFGSKIGKWMSDNAFGIGSLYLIFLMFNSINW